MTRCTGPSRLSSHLSLSVGLLVAFAVFAIGTFQTLVTSSLERNWQMIAWGRLASRSGIADTFWVENLTSGDRDAFLRLADALQALCDASTAGLGSDCVRAEIARVAAGVVPLELMGRLQRARLDPAEFSMLAVLAGDTAYGVGAHETAVATWKHYVTPLVQTSRARLLVQDSNLDSALILTEDLQGYVPNSVAARSETAALAARLADVSEQRGSLAVAEGYWQWAILQSLQRAVYHARLGAVLEAQGRLAEAVQEYEAALRTKPDQVSYHLLLARACVKLGNVAQALASVRRALELDPNNATARALLRRLE